MNQITGTTMDAREELLARLQDLIPSAFPDGDLDTGKLLEALEVDGQPAGSFSFTWPGIERAREYARAATSATLVPDPEASVNWDNARDVLIEGDNLQVLKLLKSGYRGAAKLIYIDPPYNTGETFTYKDDYSVPESEYLSQSGQVDEQGVPITSKLERGGKKHAPWLTMLFPRLAVARDLLKRDGVILVSIDDNEVHHLRLLLDAVFGANNFVDMMTWRGARKGDAKLTGGGQDYILIYARDRAYLKELDVRWRERKQGLEPIYAKVDKLRAEHGEDYKEATKALKAWYKALSDEDPSKAHAHYSVIDERGVYFPGDIASPNPRPNLMFEWKGYAVPENGWRYDKSKMEDLDADDRLVYPDSKDKRITVKRYLKEHEEWAPASVFYRDRRAASSSLKGLMDANVFANPKGTDVLARLFHAITGDGDLIIDFFAGSGSTGHAIWEQNPRDEQTRNWILIQAPEEINETEKTGKAAIMAGYKTIFDITAERLRRAADSLDESLGFRIYRTRKTNLIIETPIIAAEGIAGEEYLQESLIRAQRPPVIDDADPAAVVWEAVLKSTATRLDARVLEHELDGLTVYEFTPSDAAEDAGRLLVCLGAFTLSTADTLQLSEEDTLILRGDMVDDGVTLTLAPRLKSKLILVERVPREVSL